MGPWSLDAHPKTQQARFEQSLAWHNIARSQFGNKEIPIKGQPTRFDFDEDTSRTFIEKEGVEIGLPAVEGGSGDAVESDIPGVKIATPGTVRSKNNRVFITHGKNKKILEQVKEIVAYGKFEPVIAKEHETAARPVPEKVMDDMRSCQAAVIHVGSESLLKDRDGKDHPQVNGNKETNYLGKPL